MPSETECDEPSDMTGLRLMQVAGESSAQKVEISIGDKTMSSLARMSFVAGICATTSLVCLIGLWAVYTQTQIVKDGYNRVRVQIEQLKEQRHALPADSQ